MADNKTKLFTFHELRGLHACIKWNEQIDPWSLWNEAQQLNYVLNLILGNYRTEHPIYLQSPNYDEIDLCDYYTLFTNHTFSPIPNKPGSEELAAFYRFTNDELDLYDLPENPEYANLLLELLHDILGNKPEYRKASLSQLKRLLNIQQLVYSSIPNHYKIKVLFKKETTVIICPPT